MAHLSGLRSHVMAVEANPHTAAMAHANTASLGGLVQVINAAIVPETQLRQSRSVRFVLSKNGFWGFRAASVRKRATEETDMVVEVPGITLAQLQVRNCLVAHFWVVHLSANLYECQSDCMPQVLRQE